MSDHRIDVTTLSGLLLRAYDRWPNNNAVIFPPANSGPDRLTYKQLTEKAYARARSLKALGVKRGDHVGILMANCMEYVELLFGIALVGAVSVPMNARYKALELAYVTENADLKVLLTHDLISEYANFADLLAQAFPDLPNQRDPQNLALQGAPLLKAIAILSDTAPAGFINGPTFDEAASKVTDDEVDADRIRVSLRDTCLMMYTSGTTANPKGCPLSNESLVRTGINMNSERYFMTEKDRFWGALPMFHLSSTLPMLCAMDAGAAFLSMTHVEAGVALEMMEKEKVSIAFPSFPTVTNELISHPDFATRDLSNLRRVNNVAPPDVLRRFQDAFPQAIQTGAYGLTEASGVVSFNHPDESLELRLHSCGRPFSGMDAKIINPETGEELPAGERGEILLRGYALFDGYYKSPEKNAEAFIDGWFRTGDLCSMDKEGHIGFHGRIKDMLKVGGENVAAIEIESMLANHPSVKLAQVIGVPDGRLVEVAAAFIELNPGTTATEDEIIGFCKGKIASFKIPRHVRFVSNWPMSSTKVQKFRLLANFEAEGDAAT